MRMAQIIAGGTKPDSGGNVEVITQTQTTTWTQLQGKPNIEVSSKGIVNGLSNIPNDGADFGPDTTLGATAPGQYGSPYTTTTGVQEGINYAPNSTIHLAPGVFYISATIQASGVGTIIEGSGSGNIFGSDFSDSTVTTSIYAANGFNQDILEMLGDNQKVCNMEFYGNSPNNTYDNTYHDGFTAVIAIGYRTFSGTPYHCIVDNVTIDVPLGFGVYIETNSDHAVLWSLIQISQSGVAQGNSGGIYTDRVSSAGSNYHYGHNRILGNRIYNLASGIQLNDNNSFVFYNKVDLIGDSAISVGGNFQQVCYNMITGPGQNGISWGSSGGNCIGNTILSCGVSGSGYAGIVFGGGYGNFEDNRIDGSATYGTTTARSSYGINITSNPTGGFTPKFKHNLLSGAYVSSPVNFASGVTPSLFILDTSNDMSNSTPAYTFTPTISANPPVSGTVYQNTNNFDIEIDLPVYATTAATAGYVTVAKGSSSTPTAIGNQYVSGDTSATSEQIIRLRVPANWYYEFTGSGVTFGTASVFAD